MSGEISVFLGVGSNVDAERNLKLAWHELARLGSGLRASAVYRNSAVGFEGDDFLNLVVGMQTALNPAALLQSLEHIHALAGRRRGGEKFAPRELDIDLLLYGDVISANWNLPRPDIVDYAFVLQPLAELEPTLVHPQNGRSMAGLWQTMSGEVETMERVAIEFAELRNDFV